MKASQTERVHNPVLSAEILNNLGLKEKAPLNKEIKVIDATVGTGGHSLQLVESGVNLLGIEADPQMLAVAQERIKGQSYKLVNGNFKDIETIAKKEGFQEIDAVIFDLGVANPQLTSTERGYSFVNPEAKLDMRMNKESQGVTAADLLNVLREDQLKNLFSRVLLRFQVNYLVKKIIERRGIQPFQTVGDFLEICRDLRTKSRLNPATLPFLALRMAVNSEIENLEEALPKAFSLLKKEGKLLVIIFHSIEERIVSNIFKKYQDRGMAKILTRQPIIPSEEEINNNPRSRSAKLFILKKI